jgi:hypothetical protein
MYNFALNSATQLYNFEDKGGRRVVLRPEITPSLARLVIKQGYACILFSSILILTNIYLLWLVFLQECDFPLLFFCLESQSPFH